MSTPYRMTVYRCSYCEPGKACGFDGHGLDCSYDECHHPLDLEDAERICACVNAMVGIKDPEGFVRAMRNAVRCEDSNELFVVCYEELSDTEAV